MTAGTSRNARAGTRRAAAIGLLALAAPGLTACALPLDRDDPPPSARTLPGQPPPVAVSGPAGASDAGDGYVPGDGNGGYDVQHYRLRLNIQPGTATELTGIADITAKATQPLARFNLDLKGLNVAQVQVNGGAAGYQRDGSELVVSPAKQLGRGDTFTVTVRYSGTPRPEVKPPLGTYGWIRTGDGVFVACQPSGAHTWFPSNDHPSDKATFDFEVTVPPGLVAMANGEPTRPLPGGPGDGPGDGGQTPDPGGGVITVGAHAPNVYSWRVREPMATYLATVTVGRFNVRTGKTPSGITVITASDPSVVGTDVDHFHSLNARITEEYAKLFGPYPFGSTGGIVDDASVGFALETQNRPVYGSFGAEESIVSHELAHQWFGDSVSVRRWKDIWLNEGFASYAEWIWTARVTAQSVQSRFDEYYSQAGNRDLWGVPTGDPGPGDMFSSDAIYNRGAMTLHALRMKVGDARFFDILKTWTREHRHASGTTEEFIATANRVSGQNLDAFFRAWLFERGRPAL